MSLTASLFPVVTTYEHVLIMGVAVTDYDKTRVAILIESAINTASQPSLIRWTADRTSGRPRWTIIAGQIFGHDIPVRVLSSDPDPRTVALALTASIDADYASQHDLLHWGVRPVAA